MLSEPFFALPPPKSTGRDLFNWDWLDKQLTGFSHLPPVDVQATLTELTSRACANCVKNYGINSSQLIVCGGGSFNDQIMNRLQALLPGVAVSNSHTRGLPAMQVEAAAFAWLARKAIRREALNLRSVTGAKGERILGAIYPT
jgi:anhydro-N-acetylmuramic acid kinase